MQYQEKNNYVKVNYLNNLPSFDRKLHRQFCIANNCFH
jgi:hypothetical protein